MNLSRRSFAALALTAGLAPIGSALSGCAGGAPKESGSNGTTSSAAGALRAGVRADVMGFGYLNEKTGKYYGLEIDIVHELAERMGETDVAFITVTPDDRKEMLLEGNIDLICACYSIADSRLENFDFSPAYYTDQVIAVVQNSSMITAIEDMRGRTFGTMSGSNAAPLLSTKLYEIGMSDGEVVSANDDNSDVTFKTWHLLQFPSYLELSDALEVGTVDAMVLDGAIAKTYLNDKRSIIEGFDVAEQSYGIATQKGSELSESVAQVVQDMLDDGTIDALIDKWD